MRPLLVVVALLLLAPPALAADTGSIVDRVRHDDLLRCAATERPGYAAIDNGIPVGLAAERCRTVAKAVLGDGGRFALRLLDLDSDFDLIRDGAVELAFLEPRVVAEHRLDAVVTSVKEAYRDSFAVMVPDGTASDSLAGLQNATICFMIGDAVWPLLQEALATRGTAFRPFGFSEEVEMKDAYNVGRCGAMAGLESTLDELRSDGGVKHLRSRLVGERLGPDPVMTMVPLGDPAWAAAVTTALTASSSH